MCLRITSCMTRGMDRGASGTITAADLAAMRKGQHRGTVRFRGRSVPCKGWVIDFAVHDPAAVIQTYTPGISDWDEEYVSGTMQLTIGSNGQWRITSLALGCPHCAGGPEM